MKCWSIVTVVLILNLHLSACDAEIKQLILNARTPSSLEDTRNVTELDLNNKNITDDKFYSILVACQNIIKLSAQHHALQTPQPSLCPMLTELDLSHGTLKTFPIGAFIEKMPSLKKLDLSHNTITSIKSKNDNSHQGCFDKTQHAWYSNKLETLLVNDNQLDEIDLKIIDNATALVVADFSNNRITTIQNTDLKNRWAKTTIKLAKNLLDSTQKELLMKANIQPSPAHQSHRANGLCSGLMGGMIVGTTILLGTALGLHLSPAYFWIAIPTMGGGAITGAMLGRGIGSCITPEHERTYSPCILDFGESDLPNDDTEITMPLIGDKNQ